MDLHYSLKNQIYKPCKRCGCVDDFIVQECLRLILNKVYNFQSSPQDALQKIKTSSLNCNFALEMQLNPFDLKFHLLFNIFKRNIKDKKFLNLLAKFRNKKLLSKAYILTLFNIYLLKFDLYIEKEIQKLSSVLKQRQKKIFYIRHVNELVITLNGTYTFTVLIRNKIKTWLITELLVKPQKICIKKFKKQSLCFLGFIFKYLHKRKLLITVDFSKISAELKNYAFLHKNKSMHKNTWANFSDFQIILLYSKFIRRIFTYYYSHVNTHKELYWIYYIVKTSCVKTLCMKHKQHTMKQIFDKPKYDTIQKFPSIEELKTVSVPTLTLNLPSLPLTAPAPYGVLPPMCACLPQEGKGT